MAERRSSVDEGIKKKRTFYAMFVDSVFACCCRGFLNPNGSGSKEYYEALDVNRQSSLAEVKKAYKKLSLKFHPDKLRQRGEVMTEEKQEQFRQIKQAYEVLSDPERRRVYDRLGVNGLTLREDPQRFMSDLQDPKKLNEILEGGDWRAYSVVISVTLLIIGYVLLFPVLFALEADGDIDISWLAVFAPLWLLYAPLAFNVVSNVFRGKREKPEDWPEDEPWEDDTEPLPVRAGFALVFALFVLAQVMLCLKLDQDKFDSLKSAPWPVVLIPYFLYEIAVIALENRQYHSSLEAAAALEAKAEKKLTKAKKREAGEEVEAGDDDEEDDDDDDDPDELGRGQRGQAVQLRLQASAHLASCIYYAVRFVQVLIISCKVEGTFGDQDDPAASWWLVLLPTLIYACWLFCRYCSEKNRAGRLKKEAEEAAEEARSKMEMLTSGDESVSFFDTEVANAEVEVKSSEAELTGVNSSAVCSSLCWVAFYVLMLGFYLSEGTDDRFSVWWFYIPYGIMFGCGLCCLCTVACCQLLGFDLDEALLSEDDDTEAVDPQELERVMREMGSLKEGEEFDMEAWMGDDERHQQVMDAILLIKERHADADGNGGESNAAAGSDERSPSEDAKTKLLAESHGSSEDLSSPASAKGIDVACPSSELTGSPTPPPVPPQSVSSSAGGDADAPPDPPAAVDEADDMADID